MEKPDMKDPATYYFYRDQFERSFVSRLSHRQRLLIHPVLLTIIKIRNRMAEFHIKMLYDQRTKNRKPKIYAITHICKFDVEIASEVVHDHYYLLSGDYENMRGTIEEKFLGLNGVVYIREDDKADRSLSKEKMISILKQGGNMMYFPEGTWNLSPNLPMLPLPFGIIDVAIRAGADIIPVGMEQYGNAFHVAVGENFDVSSYTQADKHQAIEELRGRMAALKLDAWASAPEEYRSTMDAAGFEAEVRDRLSKWPNQPLEEFENHIFKPKNVCNFKEAFRFLNNLPLGTRNSFLARMRREYLDTYGMEHE